MQVWELGAREGIRETIAAYSHHVDRGHIDEVVALFAPQGGITIEGGVSARGPEQLAAFFSGVGDSLRHSEVPRIRHHTSNIRVFIDAPTRARAETYFMCVTDAGLDHWGRYRDELVAIGRRWRFSNRSVRTDGWVPGGWAARRRGDEAADSG